MAHFTTKDILKKNIEIISKEMDWENNFYLFSGDKCYFTWDNKTQEDVDQIKEKTGITCTLTADHTLIVPEYDNFVSEMEKEWQMRLSQYGVTMTYLDLPKFLSNTNLKIALKDAYHELAKHVTEEQMREILGELFKKLK